MKTYVLTPYTDFACIANRCRHNCCKGWEIDVDEDTYATWPEEYRAHVATDEDGTMHFVLLEGDVCPFLTENGLCRMILEHGEDALCEICREHPRFHNFLSDRVETGLGLCCEEAARLTLSYPQKAEMCCVENDCEDEIFEDTSRRDEAVRRLQNRAIPFAQRLKYSFDMRDALELLFTLERMDEAWTALLRDALSIEYPDMPKKNMDIPFEQFAVALTYRHGFEDGGAFFAEFSARIFMKLCAYWEYAHGTVSMDAMVEICRLYSSEVEYSDENVDAVITHYR